MSRLLHYGDLPERICRPVDADCGFGLNTLALHSYPLEGQTPITMLSNATIPPDTGRSPGVSEYRPQTLGPASGTMFGTRFRLITDHHWPVPMSRMLAGTATKLELLFIGERSYTLTSPVVESESWDGGA